MKKTAQEQIKWTVDKFMGCVRVTGETEHGGASLLLGGNMTIASAKSDIVVAIKAGRYTWRHNGSL